MPDGAMDQQSTRKGVGGAGADWAGEALNGDFHGGEAGDCDGASAPRLCLHHAALYPQLRQDLFLLERLLQSAPLFP